MQVQYLCKLDTSLSLCQRQRNGQHSHWHIIEHPLSHKAHPDGEDRDEAGDDGDVGHGKARLIPVNGKGERGFAEAGAAGDASDDVTLLPPSPALSLPSAVVQRRVALEARHSPTVHVVSCQCAQHSTMHWQRE